LRIEHGGHGNGSMTPTQGSAAGILIRFVSLAPSEAVAAATLFAEPVWLLRIVTPAQLLQLLQAEFHFLTVD
jgi:hypothetical protein